MDQRHRIVINMVNPTYTINVYVAAPPPPLIQPSRPLPQPVVQPPYIPTYLASHPPQANPLGFLAGLAAGAAVFGALARHRRR